MRGFSVVAGVLLAQLCVSARAETAPAPRKEWPVEAFAELPMMVEPQLSPNGMHLAARVARNGELLLMIASIADEPNRVRTLSLGENDLNWWRWVNDDWLIAGIGSETSVQGMPWSISRVASIKRDGSKINILAKNVAAQNGDDVIWVASDGSPRILLAYQSSIYDDEAGFWPQVDEVDVTNGRMRPVVQPRRNVMSWYADATGAVRMGVGYEDTTRMAKLLYRDDGRSNFRVIDRANRRRDESMVVPMLFTADPGKAIASDDHEGTNALYEYDLTRLELGKKSSPHPVSTSTG